MRSKVAFNLFLLLVGAIGLAACQHNTPSISPTVETINPKYARAGVPKKKIVLHSPSFTEGGLLPQDFTCNGDNVSPPLSWLGVPNQAKSLALICDDPDAPAGTWVHWIVYNLPPKYETLPQNVPPHPILKSGARQGLNDFKTTGYGGACPPAGSGAHRYVFKLYALDTNLTLKAGATRTELLQAMDGHVLAEGQLIAKYARP